MNLVRHHSISDEVTDAAIVTGGLPESTWDLCQLRWMDDALAPLSAIEEAFRFVRAKAMGLRRRANAVLARVTKTEPEPYGGRMNWEEQEDGTSAPEIPRRIHKGFKAGDLIEVLTPEEIRETLDDSGKNGGLKFLRPMEEYCGRRFRVLKPVRQILDEHNHVMQKINRTVILEGGICHGTGIYGREGCDRSCFFFWKDVWLKKVDE